MNKEEKEEDINARMEDFILTSVEAHEAVMEVSKSLFDSLLALQEQVIEIKQEVETLKTVIGGGSSNVTH